MRKLISIALLLPAVIAAGHEFSGAHGTVTVDWSAANVSGVFASGYGDSFGTEAWARKGLPEIVETDGRRCVDASYLMFDVDDDFAFDIDEDVRLELLFDRKRSGGMFISYDQNVVAENSREIEFAASTERWHTETITLQRARFANRGESGSDFTIAAPDGTWFGDPNGEHRFMLCDLKIVRADSRPPAGETGRIRLRVFDENGDPTPARIGLYDETGRMPLPSADALTIHNYDDRTRQIFLRKTHGSVPPWPHDNRYFFYIDGEYESELPAGTYHVVVSKGPEFTRRDLSVEITADMGALADVVLERWTDMPANGWYSGDDHVHMTRAAADNPSISAIMRAEDVHVSNVLQMGNPFDTHFAQYAFGPDGRYRDGIHALVPGVEDPRTAVRGHTISLNINRVYRPADRYLRYEQIFAEYRRQGGMTGFAHVAGRLFNVERGLAIDVPLGAVDFVEVLQDGVLETALWYDFLNLGFKLIPTAGSDFPYLGAPGAERNYVYLGDEFGIDAWYAALREQRTFVTNGPILELTVNGRPMGSHLRLARGEALDVVADASLNPGIEALDHLELVVQGDVVAVSSDVSKQNALSLEFSTEVTDGTWLAVRAYGVDQALAHSAPVYITLGGGFEKRSEVAELARRMIAKLAEFETVEPDASQELEAWSVAGNLETMLTEQRVQILERAAEARAVYAQMIDQR